MFRYLTSSLLAVGVLTLTVVGQSPSIDEPLRGPEEPVVSEEVVAANLQKIGLAFLNFESAHRSLPARFSMGHRGERLLSWRVHILPFMDEDELYEKFKLDEPWDSEHNRKLASQMPDVYRHSEQKMGGKELTHYLAFDFEGAALGLPRSPVSAAGMVSLAECVNGTSNTIVVVKTPLPKNATPWTKPYDFSDQGKLAGQSNRLDELFRHTKRITALMIDGSVKELTRRDFKNNPFLTCKVGAQQRASRRLSNPLGYAGGNFEPGTMQPEQFSTEPMGAAPSIFGAQAQPATNQPYLSIPSSVGDSWSSTPLRNSQVEQSALTQLRIEVLRMQDETKREAKLAEIQKIVEESFDQQSSKHGDYLKQLDAKVAKLKKAYERRQKNRDRLIQNYIDGLRLQAEGLTIPAVHGERLPGDVRPTLNYGNSLP